MASLISIVLDFSHLTSLVRNEITYDRFEYIEEQLNGRLATVIFSQLVRTGLHAMSTSSSYSLASGPIQPQIKLERLNTAGYDR